jgi:hypothetical protein
MYIPEWGLCCSSFFNFLFCALFIMVLCLLCPTLPVSCVSNAASVLCVQWCQCIVCPMVSVYCVSNVVSVLCVQCCQCLWFVHSWLPHRFSLTFICNADVSEHELKIKCIRKGGFNFCFWFRQLWPFPPLLSFRFTKKCSIFKAVTFHWGSCCSIFSFLCSVL